MTYDLVFDARHVMFPHWPAVLGAGLSVVVGYAVFTSRVSKVVQYLGLVLPLVGAPGMIVASWSKHSELTDALDSRTAEFVAGPVEGYEPPRDRRPAMFTVRGVRFCVTFRRDGAGWFEPSGDTFANGTNVRIWHVRSRVARLEMERRNESRPPKKLNAER